MFDVGPRHSCQRGRERVLLCVVRHGRELTLASARQSNQYSTSVALVGEAQHKAPLIEAIHELRDRRSVGPIELSVLPTWTVHNTNSRRDADAALEGMGNYVGFAAC